MLMELMAALHGEWKEALSREDYAASHVFTLAEDFADNFSKGIHPREWLPRYCRVLTELQEKAAQDEREAYGVAVAYGEVLLASLS